MRVLFAIDTCGREVIARQAATTDISGEMVHDLMLACDEARLGKCSALSPVQWLTDNDSAYAIRDTLGLAIALSCVPSALTVLARLTEWVEDYNTSYPRSGLQMRSPRECIQRQSQPAPCLIQQGLLHSLTTTLYTERDGNTVCLSG